MAHATLRLCSTVLVLASALWYDDLEGVKVLSPGDSSIQEVLDEVHRRQYRAQFHSSRVAILFTRGNYANITARVGYYTSVIGVGHDPSEVLLGSAPSVNGVVGALQNFWRSVEGITVTGKAFVWAVSQGAAFRRSIVRGDMFLSDNGGMSSGGFMANVRVEGALDTGTQQQWFFRNVDLGTRGVNCPIGWNYVFMGTKGFDAKRCQGEIPGKVVEIPATPRIAEKPYLVQELDGDTWNIYVPAFAASSSTRPLVGAAAPGTVAAARKLQLERDVFVARPSMTAERIQRGIVGKDGLLLTPGVYDLDAPIQIRASGFVVLGIGFPTLVAHGGVSAVLVGEGLVDVRIAGILLEASTPGDQGGAPPLLVFGSRGSAPTAPTVVRKRRLVLGKGAAPSGVLSDVFARVGSFKYEGCKQVSVQSMVEINSDDVIADNLWLWQADHDDCSEAVDGGTVASDNCYCAHSLVVNGKRVTVYGLSAEHITGGDLVKWNGEDGETYFYQAELPYHNDQFGQLGFSGYAVNSSVRNHKAVGIGVYIIGDMTVHSAYKGSPAVQLQNLVTVVIGKGVEQFKNSACVGSSAEGGDEVCFQPQYCEQLRCILSNLDQKHLSGVAGARKPSSTRFDLMISTSEQPMAGCATGASVLFLVNGKWTKDFKLFSTATPGEVIKISVMLQEMPTKVRLVADGKDPWGITRIVLKTPDGQMRTLLDSIDGDNYGYNQFWLDSSESTLAAQQDYFVPEEETRWTILTHYDLRDKKDLVQVDGSDVEAVKRLVEKGGFAGFTLRGAVAWLKPLSETPLRQDEFEHVDDAENSAPTAFFMYKVPHQRKGRIDAVVQKSTYRDDFSDLLPAISGVSVTSCFALVVFLALTASFVAYRRVGRTRRSVECGHWQPLVFVDGQGLRTGRASV